MENDLVEKNLDIAKIKWNALHWHKGTLQAKITKIEKDTLSAVEQVPRKTTEQYSETGLQFVYADARKATKEQLDARMEHYYLTMEYLEVLSNIETTSLLIAEYSKHVHLTGKEESVFISDQKINAKIKEIDDLKITNLGQKVILESLRQEFKNNSSNFSRKERFEFYTSLDNLYNANC